MMIIRIRLVVYVWIEDEKNLEVSISIAFLLHLELVSSYTLVESLVCLSVMILCYCFL